MNDSYLNISRTSLEQLIYIESKLFSDHRGINFELYNKDEFEKNDIKLDFVQDTYSRSRRDVLRGFHGDYRTWKLVSCLYGKLQMVVADFNKESPTYLEWEQFMLSSDKGLQVLIPPGLAIAHLALSDEIVFHYKQTTYYDRESQFTHAWNDPRIDIKWNTQNPILSERDTSQEIIA